MRYLTPEAFRAALDQRLKNQAAEADIALLRLRKLEQMAGEAPA